VPPLTGSWARTADGLVDRLETERQGTLVQRPITFDQAVLGEREEQDVVLAHLGHPLVARSTELLRAAVWSGETGLHRVAAVVSDHPDLTEGPLLAAYARYVLVGADGVRLHEEVLHAGGWLRPDGRFARLENLTTLDRILQHALAHGTPAGPRQHDRFVQAWPRARDGLRAAVERFDAGAGGAPTVQGGLVNVVGGEVGQRPTPVVLMLDPHRPSLPGGACDETDRPMCSGDIVRAIG
jgi:hypothetical protein